MMEPRVFHKVSQEFVVSEPVAAAVKNVRYVLQQVGYFPSDETCLAVAAAGLFGFALGGGLDDEPISVLREIISRAEWEPR